MSKTLEEQKAEFLAEQELIHYGVPGMKWGKRKTPAQEKARLEKKLDRVDGGSLLTGHGLIGYQGQKMYKKAVRKDPDFKYKNLSPEDKKKWDDRAKKRAYALSSAYGAIEVATILGVGNVAVNKILSNPQSRTGAKISVAILAGTAAKMRISEIKAINDVSRVEALKKKMSDLN